MKLNNNETTFIYSSNEPFDSSKAQEEIIEIFGKGGKALETKIEELGLTDELKLFCSDSYRKDKLLQSLSDDGFSNSRGYAYEIEAKNEFNIATHSNRFRLSNIDEDKMNGRDIVDNNNPEEVIQIKNHSQLNEYIKDIHEKIINEKGEAVLKYPHGIYIPKDHADAILHNHPEFANLIHGDYHGILLPNQEHFLSHLSQHLHRFLLQPYQTAIGDIIHSEEIGLIIAFIFTVYKNRRDIIDHNFNNFLTKTGKSLLTTSTNIASIVTAKHVIDIGFKACNLHLNSTVESAIAWMIIDTGKEAISVIRNGKSIKEAADNLKYDAIELTVGYAVASLVTSLSGGQVYIGWAAGAITKMALNSQRDIIMQFCEGNFNIGEIISNRKRPIRIYTTDELVSMGYKAIKFLEINLIECKYKEVEYRQNQYKTINYQLIN